MCLIKRPPIRLLKSNPEPVQNKRQAREVSQTPDQDIFRPSHPSARFIKIRHIVNVIVNEFHVSTFHTASRGEAAYTS